MKRFLCLSLCLGVMASGCKKKFTQADLDAAKERGRLEGAGTGTGTGGNNANTPTTKTRDQIIAACMPLINTTLAARYTEAEARAKGLYFRRRTTIGEAAAFPIVYVHALLGATNVFTANVGFGADAAAARTNVTAMAGNASIKGQFVDRANNASGLRVHISVDNTTTANGILANAGSAQVAFPANILPYGVPAAGIGNAALAVNAAGDDPKAGWYDCVRDTTTQDVSLEFTAAPTVA